MDIIPELERHLKFVGRFYNGAAEPFEATKRKIEAGEEPYVPRCEPGDFDGYEYEEEWNEAEDSLRVLGQCALGLLEKALHDYLREFAMREARVGRADDFSPIIQRCKGGSWFEKICSFLQQENRVDWPRSPVPVERIEQINLARNDVNHHPTIESTWPTQSERHFRKHPVSVFADELDLLALTGADGVPMCPVTINVTRQKLMASIEDVQQFCAFVEGHRTK
jgi:hypothetical protein